MRPVYKKVKAVAEFCPTCDERLQGSNSMASPWECRCGVWRHKSFDAPFEYTIIPNQESK